MHILSTLKSNETVSLNNERTYTAYLEREFKRKAAVYGFSFEEIKAGFLCMKDRGKEAVDGLLANGDVENPFHQIFLHSSAVWLIIDPADGRIVEANQAAARFYGYAVAELKCMKIYSINVLPEEIIREHMLHVRKQAVGSADFKHRLKDGQLRDVTVYSAPFITGNKVLCSSIIIDMTAQKEAERNLQNSRDRLAVVIEGTGAGIWEFDMLRNKFVFDAVWKRLVGYEENEIVEVGLEWEKCCHPDDIMIVRQTIGEAVRRKLDQFCLECRMRCKAGTYLWVKSDGRIIYDQQKQPLRILGSIMDISQYKKAITDQEQIRERLHASYELGRRSDIFNDLLNGTRHLDEDLTDYVRNLRLDFGHALFCCGVHIASKAGNADNLQGLKDEFIINIHGLQGCIAWNCRGHIGVVCQTLYYTDSHQISRRKLAEEIYALISREQPDIIIHIGIGEIQKGLKGFHKSFQQAWDAAEAAQQGLAFDKNIVYFQELGVFQLLLNQAGKDRAADFTRITIQKLIKYDCEKGTDYLDTLEVILQSANLKEAAETLFLHHNTVIFRKRRIEEILGQSLADFEVKLSLALAIKFYRMSENNM